MRMDLYPSAMDWYFIRGVTEHYKQNHSLRLSTSLQILKRKPAYFEQMNSVKIYADHHKEGTLLFGI